MLCKLPIARLCSPFLNYTYGREVVYSLLCFVRLYYAAVCGHIQYMVLHIHIEHIFRHPGEIQ